MAKTKGALMSLEASGKFASTIVFDKRGYARILKVPANPQSVGQTAVRNMLADIQAELKALGLVPRAAIKTDLGYRWNSAIIGELMANDNAVYDAYATEYSAFQAGEKTAWETADPAVSLHGTAGEVIYCVASAFYDLSVRAGGDGVITEPAHDNAATVGAEWIADA